MSTGSIKEPYRSLKAALENTALEAGDTIWLGSGVHIIDSEVTIAADNITIRPQLGQRAVIEFRGDPDNIPHHVYFNIDGDNIRFRDMTIRGAPTFRTASGQGEDDYPDSGWIRVRGRPPDDGLFGACTLIDLITVTCFALSSALTEQVLYRDCTILNYGLWEGDEGNGEGAYLQNNPDDAVKKVENTIFGPGYGVVMQVYSQGSASVNNFIFSDLIMADDLSGARRLYIYTIHGADNIQVVDSIMWGAHLTLGAFNAENGAAVLTGNYMVKATAKHSFFGDWADHTVDGNTLVCIGADSGQLVIYDGRNGTGTRTWNNSTYHHQGTEQPFREASTLDQISFAAWQSDYGYDADSTYSTDLPGANLVFVKPCSILPRKGHIAIFNWQELDAVTVDVSSLGLGTGTSYRLRSAYDPDGDTSTFVYDGSGSLDVSFIDRTVAIPSGDDDPLATIDKRFGAWWIEHVI